MKYTITKRYKFDAAHFLPQHPTCGQVHGHTWHVDVSVTGLSHDGMVVDFHLLDGYVKPLITMLDHQLVNAVLVTKPTCENIAAWFLCRIKGNFSNQYSIKVTVQEGEGGWATAEEE